MEDLVIVLNFVVLCAIAIGATIAKSYIPKYLAEKAKTDLNVKSALRQSFQSKSLDALAAIDNLLVEIHLYCWKRLSDYSLNEHYVWSNVDTSEENRHFHYYRVAIDKVAMVHSLYLTPKSIESLSDLSGSIGQLSSMELTLINEEREQGKLDESLAQMAFDDYTKAIEYIEQCRAELKSELGVQS
ncbi:TPA: hypothetical protein KD131_004553 [Vibrio parahaemolyticus]|nr:hypothetical protein [Vibrio parahaemolyticus]ELA9727764.1 hypothetical protein [Vibrio parahaemolyticus]MDG2809606.1 hypothetical protein [Vibrio parahaemolyticus]HBC3612525.1 hypothetical protein [Vibrio parahaemolyticus]HBN6296967.1 hypothetical protein [Vibrio parahaemolyticus]